MALAGGLALADVDRAHRDSVPDARRPDQEPGVDGLVVRGGAVALGADDLVAGDVDAGHLDRAGLVASQAERVPAGRLRLHVLAVDDEHGKVVVAREVRTRRLDDVEIGEPARGRPRGLLADVVAAVRTLGPRGDRVPEVRAGLGIAVGQRADLAAVQRLYVLLDQGVGGAEHDRVDRAHVHDVTHRGGGAAVARDRLARHRVGDVVLAEAAVLGRHRKREEAVLAEQLEVAPRELQLVVGDLGVGPHLLLAQLDQEVAEFLLAVGEHPFRVPLVTQSPEGLATPSLLGHLHPPLAMHKYVQYSST